MKNLVLVLALLVSTIGTAQKFDDSRTMNKLEAIGCESNLYKAGIKYWKDNYKKQYKECVEQRAFVMYQRVLLGAEKNAIKDYGLIRWNQMLISDYIKENKNFNEEVFGTAMRTCRTDTHKIYNEYSKKLSVSFERIHVLTKSDRYNHVDQELSIIKYRFNNK